MKTVKNFVQFLPIWIILKFFKVFPIEKRSYIVGTITAKLVGILPNIAKRVDDNLCLIFPDMPRVERNRIRENMGRHIGRTLSEILFNKDYAKQLHRFHATGPGLEVLQNCKDAGIGAIIVSGHFGQWEAIRHYLKAHNMETGAVYRPTGNQFYEPYFLQGIKEAGEPIVPRGFSGVRTMIKTLRSGSFMAILIDQRQNDAEEFNFMGHRAKTSLAAAELALKLDIPLVPVFAKRSNNGVDIEIDFEAPIPKSNAVEMTQIANVRLELRIRQTPEQWFWVHKRWNNH